MMAQTPRWLVKRSQITTGARSVPRALTAVHLLCPFLDPSLGPVQAAFQTNMETGQDRSSHPTAPGRFLHAALQVPLAGSMGHQALQACLVRLSKTIDTHIHLLAEWKDLRHPCLNDVGHRSTQWMITRFHRKGILRRKKCIAPVYRHLLSPPRASNQPIHQCHHVMLAATKCTRLRLHIRCSDRLRRRCRHLGLVGRENKSTTSKKKRHSVSVA